MATVFMTTLMLLLMGMMKASPLPLTPDPDLSSETNVNNNDTQTQTGLNISGFNLTETTNNTRTGLYDRAEYVLSSSNRVPCPLATCLTTNLSDKLQSGDESAGGSTRDPFGPGKK